MTATYSKNGEAVISIPGGIFSFASPFTIDAKSLGLADAGAYKISVSVSDYLSNLTTSFTLTITNASPRLVSTPPPITAP